MKKFPTVSVVIPSLHGNKKNLERLKNSVLNSGIPRDKLEVITSIGVSPNGRARDVAVMETGGEYLICMDDDVHFPDPTDLKSIIEFLASRQEVGLAGPAQQLPPELTETETSRARQMIRTHVEQVDEFTETDMVTHACLAISRELFIDIGMEHPNLISGTDPDLRNRVRNEGYKVGLVPHTRVYHPPVTNWIDHLMTNFTGGRRSYAVKRDFPSYHYDAVPDRTDPESRGGNSAIHRLERHFRHLFNRMKNNQIWALSGQISYIGGNLWERLFSQDWVDPIPYPEDPSPDHPEWDEFVNALKSEGETRWLHGPIRPEQ